MRNVIKAKWPYLTDTQIAKFEKHLEHFAGMGDDVVTMVAENESEKHPELIRKAPTKATAQAFLEAEYRREHGTEYISPTARVDIARRLQSINDPDELLALVPASFGAADVKQTELDKLTAQKTPGDTFAADNAWLREHMGIENPGAMLASKRAELLAKRDEISGAQGRLQDAKRVDAYSLKDPDQLTAYQRLELARASASLK